jgi:hypothetical protein
MEKEVQASLMHYHRFGERERRTILYFTTSFSFSPQPLSELLKRDTMEVKYL